MAQLHDLRTQEAEAQSRLTKTERQLQTAGDREGEFLRLLESWIALHRQRGDSLEKQCDRFTELSAGEIRAQLIRGADMDQAIEALKETVGGSSSSVMVAVCCVVAPGVAFVGVPMSTMTVSSYSSIESATTLMVIAPWVEPALIVTGLAVTA